MLLLTGCSEHEGAAVRQDGQSKPNSSVQRIVSMNPCVDAILMEVAEHKDIASISHYSLDPQASSISTKLAAGFAVNSGSAEEVIAANPDLVITGPHVSLSTSAALERLGIPMLKIGVPSSIAESKAQIDQIATRIGRSQAGAALIKRIDAAVARNRRTGQQTALIRQGGGLVPGTGTLADAMLKVAGYRNMSRDYGLASWDILPLEPLINNPPDILFAADSEEGKGAAAIHPVMAQLQDRIAVRDFPPQLLNCGGPTIIRALDQLGGTR